MSYKTFRGLIEKGNEQGMTEFLEKEFPKNEKDHLHCDYEQYNILKDLIRHGKKDMIRKYIEKGFPLNIDREDKSFDGTPLHVAVLSEYPEIVQILLDSGSCIYKNNGNEETPLLLSAIAGIDQVTDLLLSYIEPRDYFNREGFSHFHVACMRNQVELVHQFLICGTDIHHSVKKGSQFWSGFTPLHFAVEFRSIETVEFLVKNGADITIQNEQGLTPLHLAFRKRNKKMIDLILSTQCFFVQNPFNKEGLSHFHIACATNNVKIVRYFLQKKLNVLNYRIPYKYYNWSSYDAFCFATNNDSTDVLEQLLKSDDHLVKRMPLQVFNNAHVNGSHGVLNLINSHFEKKMVTFQCKSLLENQSTQKQKSITKVQSQSSVIEVVDFKIFEISRQTTLHHAVLYKDSSLVNSLLETCPLHTSTMADLNEKTPLHLAFETNQMNLVQKLLDRNLYTGENPTDRNGLSHFHIACTAADVNVVKDFLQKGIDVNSPVKIDSPIWAGFTPLHFAIWFCQIEVSKLLLKEGANFAAKNAANLSPFDFTIPDVIRLCYKSSNLIVDYKDDEDIWDLTEHIILANCDRRVGGFDDRGITPLHVAAMNNDIRLIENLANVDNINKRTDLSLPPWYAGLTPLHFAVWYGNREAAEILLEHGADVTIQSGQKKTAAHICDVNLTDVRAMLLFSPKNLRDEDGLSLFHLACKWKNIEAVKNFLKLGVDVNQPVRSKDKNTDEEESTPLHLAVEADDPEIVKLLLEHGANVDARDRCFHTPMSSCKSIAVLRVLLDHGADPQALDLNYKTALYNALFYSKNISLFPVLKENGWDINEVNENTSIDELQPKEIVKVTLTQHITSLMELGVAVNENIKSLYFPTDRRIVMQRTSVVDLLRRPVYAMSAFGCKCITELNLTKKTKIDNRTTLYDILLKNSKDMVKYSKNETLQKIVNAEPDLRQNYPIYGYLIILQFKKGQNRANLVEEGKTSLSFIANQWLGDVVSENILRFLNDYDIQYLIYASSGQNIFPR